MKKEEMPEESDNLNHNNLPELDNRIGMNENTELLTKTSPQSLLDTWKATPVCLSSQAVTLFVNC